MPTFLAELLAQMRAIWGRLDAGQRTVVVAVLVGTLGGLAALVVWAGRPDYQVVLTSDDGREFAQATAALQQANVAYKLEGRSILVEAGHAREAQSALFAAGVAAGDGADVGEGLSGITMDSQSRAFQLDLKKRQLAERAVRALQGVNSVTVSFSKPKRALYAVQDDETAPRASITLGIVPGQDYRRIARAARQTVSSALGMPPEHVSVINATTAELYRGEAEPGGDLLDSGDFLALQQRRAEELQSKAHHVLEASYPGQVRVAVTVELDPRYVHEKRTITPETPLVKSDKLSEQDTGGSGGASGAGDPSTTGAVSGNANTQASAAPSNKNKTRDREFVTAIGTSESGMLSPDIRKLSVALLIDEAAVQSDAAKVDRITNLVKGAIGWSDERDGADLKVLVEKFKPAPPIAAEAGPGVMGLVREFGPAAGQVVAVVLVLLFLRGLLRRSQRPLPARTPGRAAAPRGAAAGTAAAPAEELAPEEDMKRARKEIERAIADDPGAVSRLLESWLVEQRN